MTSESPVSSIRNLGPVSARQFAKAGITSAEKVRSLGADRAYQRLIAAGAKPHFIGYYALVLGLQGRHWTSCLPEEKTRVEETIRCHYEISRNAGFGGGFEHICTGSAQNCTR